MYNYGIIGDVHIDVSVSSRKDDYFTTCLEKLTSVAQTCKNVIFLGDVFNKQVLPNEYFTRLYTHLKYLMTTYNCRFYSIVGNHDIYNEQEVTLSKTTLGICALTGIITIIPIEGITIDDYKFYSSYVNLEKAKNHISTLSLKSTDILLLHQYFEDAFPGLSFDDVNHVGCKNIFVGHEHTPFPKLKKCHDDISVFRCGSLLRNAATSSNLSRRIFYFVFNTLDDIIPYELDNYKPASDVFTPSAFNQENLTKKRFVQSIDDVINKYTNNITIQDKFSIKTILLELKASQNCISYINDKYNKIGEVLF